MISKKNIAHSGILVILIIISLSSCKKFVEVAPPKDQLGSKAVFKDSVTTLSTLTGLYNTITLGNAVWQANVPVLSGFTSDEISSSATSRIDFQTNNIQPSNSDDNTLWTQPYNYIYQCNSIIEGVNNSAGLSLLAKRQFTGEAKFLRAYFYFYLTNFFGSVPLITTTDVTINASLPRADSVQIYNQIVSDLKEAQISLPEAYATVDKLRPNKWMATAFLAKVYLYLKDYSNAEILASRIINSGLYNPLPNLASAFLRTSKETLWQLVSPSPRIASLDGANFVPTGNDFIPNITITNNLLNAFEATDQRKSQWLGINVVSSQNYYYPAKYKQNRITAGAAPLELQIIMRLSEVYLIRAEARAHNQSEISDAVIDINVIRSRAGLAGLPSNLSQSSALAAIAHERQVELFAENANRWFDLKRTGTADAILKGIKGSNWQATDVLYPVPSNELLRNSKLTQNIGY